MSQSPTASLHHQVSTFFYGFVGVIVAIGTLATGIWISQHADLPTFIRYACGGITFLIGLWFLRYAITDAISSDSFESQIQDGIYRQRFPRKRDRGSFELPIKDIVEIQVRNRSEGDCSYHLITADEQRERITNTYWNPIQKILLTLVQENPDLIFRDDRNQQILKHEIIDNKLRIEPGAMH